MIPGADAVSARQSLGILALIGQIAQFRDHEGAAAKADDRAGGERRRLVRAVATAGIAAEHRRLQGDFVNWFEANPHPWSGKRVSRPSGGKVGGKECRPADSIVDEIRRGLALEELAVRRHETRAD